MSKIDRPFVPQQPGAGIDNYIDGGPTRAGLEELRGKANSAPVVFGTVAEAEAATYTVPEAVIIAETGRTYIYSANSEAARDGIRVLVPAGEGRLLMTVPAMTDAEVAAAIRASSPTQSGLMSAAQSAGLVFLLEGCYGGIHVHDASESQSITSGVIYTKLTCFIDNDPASNCTADAANNKITLTKTGRYQVMGKISTTASVNNTLVKMAAFLDGVEQDNCHSEIKLGPAGDMDTLPVVGIVECIAENTDLDLRLAHDSASSVNVTIKYANLNVQWIGNT